MMAELFAYWWLYAVFHVHSLQVFGLFHFIDTVMSVAAAQIKVSKILQELAESEPKAHSKHQMDILTNKRITDDKPS